MGHFSFFFTLPSLRLLFFVSLFPFPMAEKNKLGKEKVSGLPADGAIHPYTLSREGLRAHVIKDGETTQQMWLPQATG